jgi:hypothetical protein
MSHLFFGAVVVVLISIIVIIIDSAFKRCAGKGI